MASLTLTIPDDKVALVLAAYVAVEGIEPTLPALKAKIRSDVLGIVKQYERSVAATTPIDIT